MKVKGKEIMQKILECQNLCKSFGKKQILKNVSFEIDEKDILAFIGPNGSGKTTTIKLILGLQNIDSGSVKINGYDVEKDFVKSIEKVGAIVENPDTYMYLSGWQNLKLVANLYKGVTDDDLKTIVKTVGLENRIHDKVSKYSLGMRQRLGIARALINKPNLLVLDEPTNGLDPKGIHEIRELIINLAKEGKTIFISSHILGEIELIATDYAIIHKGKLIFKGDVNKLRNLSETKLIIKTNDNNKALEVLKDNDIQVSKVKDFIIVKDNKINNNYIAYTNKILVNNNIDVYHLNLVKKSLEEIFLEMTGEGE